MGRKDGIIYTKYTHTNIRKTLITTFIFISECGSIVAAGIYNLPSSTIHLTFTLFLSKHLKCSCFFARWSDPNLYVSRIWVIGLLYFLCLIQDVGILAGTPEDCLRSINPSLSPCVVPHFPLVNQDESPQLTLFLCPLIHSHEEPRVARWQS